MNDVWTWLHGVLVSWLTTWEGLDEDPDCEPEYPVELEKIIQSIDMGYTKFTSEAYDQILFQLYCKFSDPDFENSEKIKDLLIKALKATPDKKDKMIRSALKLIP